MKKIALLIIVGLVVVSLFGCGKSQPKREEPRTEPGTVVTEAKQETSQKTENPQNIEPESESDASTEPEEESESEPDESPIEDGLSPEFKEAMDSYEAFFDEYVEFMKTYADSDNPTALLLEYAEYMEKYTDAMEKLDKLEEDLTPAEDAYYIATMARIQQKLLEVY